MRGSVGAGTRSGMTKSGLPRKKRHSASRPSAMAAPRPILPPHHVRPPGAHGRQFQHHAGIAEPHVARVVRGGQCLMDHQVRPEPRRAKHIEHRETRPQLARLDPKAISAGLRADDCCGQIRIRKMCNLVRMIAPVNSGHLLGGCHACNRSDARPGCRRKLDGHRSFTKILYERTKRDA